MNRYASTLVSTNPVSPPVSLFSHFPDLPDPRIDRTKRHKRSM